MNRRSLLVTLVLISLFSPCPTWAVPIPATRDDLSAEDRPAKLSPKAGRTPAEEDHIAAAALFAHARVLMQRQDYAAALRRLQRAWRLDQESLPILTEIVPLAFELKRTEEAARYTVLVAERDPKEAPALIRLAAYVANQKEMSRAAGLYEKAIALHQELPQDLGTQLLHLEMGRHYLTLDKKDASNKEKAAAAFTRIRDALDKPEHKKVAKEILRALGGKPETLPLVLGDGFFQAGRFDDAAAMYRRVNEAKKNDDLLAFRLARIDAERGDVNGAMEKLNRYLEANLSEAGTNAYDLLEQLLRKQNFDEKAANAEMISRLEKLRTKFDSNVPLNFSLAEQYRKAKKFDKAEALYTELLKQQTAVDLYQGLLTIYKEQGQVEKLLAMLGQAILKVGSLDALGDVVDEISGNKELLDKLAKPATLTNGAAWALSQLFIDAKRYDAADEFFELALAAPEAQKAQILVGYGLQMFAAEQSVRAAKAFRRAIDDKVLPENNQLFYYYLSGALALANKHEEAAEAAKKAIAAGPKTPRFQSRLAWIPYHAKHYAEAEKAYLELLKEYDSDYVTAEVRETMRETRLVLSNLCVLQKRIPQAEEWLEQVLDEFPEDAGAANDLGYLWADQGKNLHRALAMTQRAVNAEPKNKAYRDSLGWAFYRLGRFTDAVRELSFAADVEEPDGVILDHLGDAQASLNQKQVAIATWKKAVESFKKEKEEEKQRLTEEKIKKAE